MVFLKLCCFLIIYKNELYESYLVEEEFEKINNLVFDYFLRVSSIEKK